MIAPNVASNYPQQPAAPQQPSSPQGGYGAPQQPGYGTPAVQPGYGQPGQPGGPPFGGGYAGGGKSGGGSGKLIAIIGGALGALLLVVILVVVLFKVVLGGGPEDTAKDYLQAQLDRDYEKVCDLTAEDPQKDLLASVDADDCGEFADKSKDQEDDFADELKDFDEVLGDTDIEFETDDAKESGDSATVKLTIKYEYKGDDDDKFREVFGEDDTKGDDTETVKLVKEDGDWKVKETSS
jgi:hypothetical protein